MSFVLSLDSFAAPKFCVTPYLQRPATDAMTIIFFTDSACTATVEAWPEAARSGSAPYRATTAGEWAQALTNNVFHLNRNDNEEKNKWNNSLYRHRMRFEGLKPNCSYDYTVTLDGGASYSNTFRTAPDRDTPIRFASYADCETTSSRFANYTSNLKMMKSRDPDLITSAGDLTARGGIQSHWDEFWMQNAGGNGIGATDILGSIPMLTAIGNHDLFDNADHTVSGGWFHDRQGEVATEKFLSYFEVNPNGVHYEYRDGTKIPETRDMSQLFHRVDYGPVTLIFLDTNNGQDGDTDADHDRDTNYDKPGDSQHTEGGMDRRKGGRHPDFNPGTLQYAWLTNNLADAQRKSRFTFVFNHHCPYSVGGHNKSWSTGEDASALAVRVLTETMVRYGVDGWYCGHDELLEHSITNGYEILPNGQRRKHTLSIYDLGCSGDGARSSSGAANPLKYWQGSGNYGGTGSYGFLETDVTTNKNGKWTCTITPVQGSTGNYVSGAQIVYVENPDRGQEVNDLVYAEYAKTKAIDGVSSTKPSDWLAFTRDSSPEPGEETDVFEYVSSSVNQALDAAIVSAIKAQTDQNVKYVFRGTSAANGWNLGDFSGTTLNTHLVFGTGSHRLDWASGNSATTLFAKNATDGNPTILVGDGATLNMSVHDLSGYQGSTDAGGVIRVNAGGTLNFSEPSSGSYRSFNYRQRLVLDPGSLTTFSYTSSFKFILHGNGATPGTAGEGLANVYVPESATDQTANPAVLRSTGAAGLGINPTSSSRGGGCAVFVGANSKLLLDTSVVKGEENSGDRTLAKLGAGELEITGEVTGDVAFDARAGVITLPASAGKFNKAFAATADVTYRFPAGWTSGKAYALGSGTVSGTAPAANAATVYVGSEKLTGVTLSYSGKTVTYGQRGDSPEVPSDPAGSDSNVTLEDFHAGMVTNFTTATSATQWNCKSSDDANLRAEIVRNGDGTATVTVSALYSYGSSLTVKVYSGSSTAGSGTLVRTITFSKLLPEERTLSLKVGETATDTCTFHSARSWSCTASPSGIVNASMSSGQTTSSTLTLTGKSAGTATVTVTRDSSSNKTETYVYRVTVTPGASAGAKFSVTPYLQHPAPTEMTILFFTSEECAATVTCDGRTYNATCGQATELVKVASDDQTIWGTQYRHRVRLTGLRPNTTYRYEVALDGGETYANELHTVPTGLDASVRFVAYSDSETIPPDYSDTTGNNHATSDGRVQEWDVLVNGQNQTKTYHVSRSVGFASNLLHMASWKPDFYVVAGDLTARGGVQLFWDEFWKENAGGLGRGYGDPAGSAPILATMGNHDHYDNKNAKALSYNTSSDEIGLKKYLTYFEFEPNGVDYANSSEKDSKNRDRSQLFHRMDYGPVTILFLDTNKGGSSNSGSRTPSFDKGSLQYQWIEANLKDARDVRHSRFLFVVSHQDPYSCGKHNKANDSQSTKNVRDQLTGLMLQYGVTGWLAGHDEMQEHAQVTGTEVLADGSTRAHTMNVYDLGSAGDGLKGVREFLDNEKYMVFAAYSDSPDGTHYGHLQVEVAPKDGVWYCTMTPAYSYFKDANSPSELRLYDDRLVVRERESPASVTSLAVGETKIVETEGTADAWSCRLTSSNGDADYAQCLGCRVERLPDGRGRVYLTGLGGWSDGTTTWTVTVSAQDPVVGEETEVKTITVSGLKAAEIPLQLFVGHSFVTNCTFGLARNWTSSSSGSAISVSQTPASGTTAKEATLTITAQAEGTATAKLTRKNGSRSSDMLVFDVTVVEKDPEPESDASVVRTVGESATVVIDQVARSWRLAVGDPEKVTAKLTKGMRNVTVDLSADHAATEPVKVEVYATRFSDGAEIKLKTIWVTVKPLTLTLAAAQSVTYDGTVKKPVVTVKAGDREVSEDCYEIGNWSGELKAAGSYTATVTGRGDAAGSVTLGFAINPAPVTVRADDKTKEVNGVDPELTATVTGTFAGETVKYVLARAAGEDVGTYMITASGADRQGNYTVSFEPGIFRISKTVAHPDGALTAAIVYGTKLSGATVSGKMKDRGGHEVKGVFAFAEPDRMLTVAESGAKCRATFTPDDRTNYDPSEVEVAVTVAKKALTVKASSVEIAYGDKVPDYKFALTGFIAGEDATKAGVSGAPTYACTYAKGADAGDYEIAVEGVGTLAADNYSFEKSADAATLTVEPLAVKVTPTAGQSVVFGAPISVIAWTSDPGKLVEGDVWTGALALEGGTGVGAHRIVRGTLAIDDGRGGANYDLTVVETVDFTVRKIPLDVSGVTFESRTVTYNGEAQTVEIGSGLPSGVRVSYSGGDRVDAGTYTVTATFTAADAGTSEITGGATKTATLKIEPATITSATAADMPWTGSTVSPTVVVLAGDLVVPVTTGYTLGSWKKGTGTSYGSATLRDIATYTTTVTGKGNFTGTQNLTFSIVKADYDFGDITFADRSFTYDGKAHTLTISGTLPSGLRATYANNGRTDAGSQTATVSFSGADSNHNTPPAMTATLTVVPAALTSATAANQTYAGQPLTPVVTAKAGTLDATFEVGGWDGDLTAAKTYRGTATGTGNFTGSVPVSFTVDPKPVTVQADALTKEYGVAEDPPLTATVTGTLAGDTVAYTVSRAAGEAVGSYLTTPKGEELQGNYAVTYKTAYFKITKAIPKPTGPLTATIVYGTKLSGANVKGTMVDRLGNPVRGTFAFAEPERVLKVAESGIVCKATFAADDSQTYDPASVEVTVAVRRKELTVSAADRTVTYGDEPPDYGCSLTGFVNGENASVVSGTCAYSCAYAKGADAGIYDIGLTSVDALEADNYSFKASATPGKLTVNPKPVTVTALDTSKTYGQDDPAFAAKVADAAGQELADGLVAYTLTRTAGANAGTYTIIAAGEADQGNYKVTFKNGTFTVNKAVIVSATAASMPWTGGTLTPTVIAHSSNGIAFTSDAGFSVGNWKKSGSAWGTATLRDVGTYTATVSAKSGGNLTVSGTVTVTFEITKADYDMSGVTFADRTFTYDGKAHALTVSGTLPGGLRATYANNSRTDAGEQTATVTFSGADANHSAPPAMTATLRVEPAALTSATAANQVFAGKALTPVVTATAGTLAATTFDVGGWDGDLTAAWTYHGKVTGTGNFKGTVDVTFTVTRAKVVVKADDKSKGYGEEEDPPLTATVTGNFNGDTVAYTVSRAPGNDVGTYDITAGGDAVQGNYQVTYQSGTFTVTRTRPVPAGTLTAEITYGENLSAAAVDGVMKTLAGVEVAGSFAFATPGQVLAAGEHECAATFLPDDVLNYVSANVTVLVTVGKKALRVRAADLSVTYGTEDPAYKYVLSGFVSGESTATVTISGEPTYASSYAKGTAVGEYGLRIATVGTLEADNYSFTVDPVAATLKVTPKAVTVTAEDKRKTYGEPDPEFTAKVEGVVGGETVEFAYWFAREDGEDVRTGGYAVTPSGDELQGNYSLTFKPGTLTVEQAEISSATAADLPWTGDEQTPAIVVRADDLSVPTSGYALDAWKKDGKSGTTWNPVKFRDIATYTTTVTGKGNFKGTCTLSFKIVKADYDLSGITFADGTFTYNGSSQSIAITGTLPSGLKANYTNNSRTDAGSQTATVTFSGADGNHNTPAAMTATLTIDPATLTSATAGGSTYDGTAKSPTVTAKAGSLAATVELVGVWDGDMKDAGTYHAKVRGTGNFDGELDVSYAIAPAALTSAAAANQTYDGGKKTPVLAVMAGSLAAAPADYDLSVWSGELVAAGTYTAEVSGKGNFTGTVPVKFTIDKATYAMDGVSFTSQTVTYDGKAHSLAVSGTLPAGVSVRYVGNGQTDAGSHEVTAKFEGDAENYNPIADKVATLRIETAKLTAATAAAATYTGPVQTPKLTVRAGDLVVDTYTVGNWNGDCKNAGTFKTTVTGTGNFTGTAEVEFTIKPAQLTIRANDQGVKVREDPATFTAVCSGFVDQEDESVLEGVLVFGCDYNKETAQAGQTFDITPSGVSAGNYEITFLKGTLTVGKSTPKLASLSADAITYGRALSESKLTGSAQDGVQGTFAWTDGSIRPTVAESGKEYDVTFTPADDQNYTVAHFKAAVEVKPAELTVTAEDATVTYGDAAPAYSCTIAGFVNGEDEDVVNGARKLACGYQMFDNAGTYAITAVGETFDAENYAFKFVDGTLTVEKATLTVAARDAAVTYWDPPPDYVAAYAGFLGTDTVAVVTGKAGFTCEYGRGSDVGTYGIGVSDLSGLESLNYRFVASATPGTLTVNRKAVTVTADDKTKPYGAGDPTFTATVTGTVGDRGVSFSLAVDYRGAEAAEAPVGSYTIVASGAADQGNYAVAYKSGTMTVGRSGLTGDGLKATMTYGQALGEAKVSGTVRSASNGQEVRGALVFRDPDLKPSVAEGGSYVAVFTPENTASYAVTELPVEVTVARKTLTVKARDEAIVYGDEPPDYVSEITGFVDGEDADVLEGACTYACAYAQYDGVGSYSIEVGFGNLKAANYTFAAADPAGRLTVGHRSAWIVAKDATKAYGTADPAFEVTVEGTVNGDVLTNAVRRAAGEDVREGGYEIKPTGDAVQGNYTVAYEAATLTINPASLSGASAVSQVYDGQLKSPVLRVRTRSGFVSSSDYVVSDWNEPPVGVGFYWATVTGIGNYTGEIDVEFEITKARYDRDGITFADASVEYDGEPHSLEIGGALPEGVTVAYEGGGQTEAGSHVITAKFTVDERNYEPVTPMTATLTIKSVPIATVEVEPESYDGRAKSPKIRVFTASGLEVKTFDVGDWSGDGDLVDCGTYEAEVTGTGNFRGKRQAVLVIRRASATIVVENKEKEYKAEDPALTAQVKGLFGSDEVTYSLARTAGEEPGEYEVGASFEEIQGNYTVSAKAGTFTVVPAKPAVKTDFTGELTYGGALDEAKISGAMIGHAEEPVSGRIVFADAEKAPAVAESGAYDATFVPDDTKHYAPVPAKVAVTVNRKELKVRAKDKAVTFGDEPPAQGDYDYVCEGLVNGDAATVVTGTCGYDCAYRKLDNIGDYPISVNVEGLSAANYRLVPDEEKRGQLMVAPKSVVVKADDRTRTYGQADPALTVTITGRVDSAEIRYEIAREAGDVVGEYLITPTGEPAQGNYAVSYETGTFTITPAEITSATAASEVYDGKVHRPVLTVKAGELDVTTYDLGAWSGELVDAGTYTTEVTGTGNFCGTMEVKFVIAKATYDLSGVTFAGDTVTYDAKPHTIVISGQLPAGVTVSYDIGEQTNAGTYPMTASFAGDAVNYEPIAPLTATLVIRPRAITSVAADGATYDGKEHKPTLTVLADGLELAMADYALGSWSGVLKTVGTYTAAVTGRGNFSGEDVVYFTIAAAKATVTANAATKEYGVETDPELTMTVEGTFDGDTVECVVTRAEGEDVGEYVITASGEKSQGNYEVAYRTGTFTITAATPEVGELTAHITYGQTLADAETNVVGVIRGHKDETIAGTFAFDMPEFRPEADESGTYPATFTPTDGTHYRTIEVEVEVEVEKKELAVQAVDAVTTYGEEAPDFEYVLRGFIEGEDADIVEIKGDPMLTCEYAPGDDIGEYEIRVSDVSRLASSNYCFVPSASNATLTVVRRAATVTAVDSGKTYGSADPAFGVTVTGLYGSDGVTNGFVRAAGEDVGTYDLAPTGEAIQGNYDVTYVPGVFTISPRALTSATAANQTYDGKVKKPVLSVKADGLDVDTYDILGWSGDLVNAGTYTATVRGRNNFCGEVTVTFTIDRADYDLGDVTFEGGHVTYDGQPHALQIGGDLPEGVTVDYEGSGTDCGTYTITARFAGDDNHNPIADRRATLTVDPRPLVGATTSPVTYDGKRHEPSVRVSASGLDLPVTYVVGKWSGNLKDAGTYQATVTGTGNFCGEAIVTFVIRRAAVTVAAVDCGKEYKADDPELTATVTGTLDRDTVEYAVTRTAGEEIGTYAITPNGKVDQGNYTLAFVDGTFTITAATPEVGELTARITYGQALADAETNVVGVIRGHKDEAVAGTFAFDVPGFRPVVAESGTYPATFTPTDGARYRTIEVEVEVEVGKKELTVQAVDAVTTYGEEAPDFEYVLWGFVEGEDADIVEIAGDPTLTCDYAPGDDIGEYDIVVADTGDLASANYSFVPSASNATLTVVRRAATVTAVDSGKTYGSADPAFGVTVTGLYGSDGVTNGFVRAAGEDVGTYDLAPTGGAIQGNYDVTYKSGDFEITPATLVVSPVDAVIRYGDPLPEFGCTYAPLLRGDTASVVSGTAAFQCPYVVGNSPGAYPITVSSVSRLTSLNYIFVASTSSATLTVEKAFGHPTDWTDGEPGAAAKPAGNVSKFDATLVYNGEAQTIDTNALAAAYAPYRDTRTVVAPTTAPGAIAYALTKDGPWSAEAPTFVNVCTTTFWYRVELRNYEDAVRTARLTVTNRAVTITSKDYSVVYDGEPHFCTNVTLQGFVAGEGAVCSNFPTVVGKGIYSNAFEYALVLNPGSVPENYAVTCVTGQLSIANARNCWTLAPTVSNKVYDGQPAPTNAYVAKFGPVSVTYDGGTAPVVSAGVHTNTFKVVGTVDYTGLETNVQYTISKAELTVIPTNVTCAYGDAQPAYGYTLRGFVGGESAETVAVSGEPHYACDYVVGETDTGTYPITVSSVSRLTSLNYAFVASTVSATLTVEKAFGHPTDWTDGEPGAAAKPAGNVSKFDATLVYNGEAQTIDTNALAAAYAPYRDTRTVVAPTTAPGAITYALTKDGPWSAEAPIFMNVCTTTFWYRVELRNYEDAVRETRLTITNRAVTLTSATETFVYDGAVHSNATVTVGGEGFVEGEGFRADDFATIMDDGAVDNSFDYELELKPGSVPENYLVTVVTGRLETVSTVTFDSAGGSAVAPITTNCGARIAAPADPVRAWYAFAGWFEGEDEFVFTTMPAGGAALTAHWDPKPGAPENPWTIGPEGDRKAVQAYFDPDLETVVLELDGTKAIDLVALTNGLVQAGVEVFSANFNAMVKTDVGAFVTPSGWADAKAPDDISRTLGVAIEKGVASVVVCGDEPPAEIVEKSEVEVEPGVTNVVTAAVENDPTGVESNAIQVIAVEGLVEIAREKNTNATLTVVALSEADVGGQDALALMFTNTNGLWDVTDYQAAYVDLAVYYGDTPVSDLDKTIAIRIPWSFDAQCLYRMARIHNGVAEPIPEGEGNKTAAGEYFERMDDGFVLHVAKFSNYAIAEIVGKEGSPVPELYDNVAPEALAADPFVGNATYYGWTRGADGEITGSLVIKAAKANKNTGVSKLTVTYTPVGGKKQTIKLDADAMPVVGGNPEVTIPGIGTVKLSGHTAVGVGCSVQTGKDLFKDKETKKQATTAVPQGTWTFALPSAAGYAGFSVTVAKTGKTKVKGVMPDGTKVSVSVQGVFGDNDKFAVPVVYAKKAVSVSFVMWIDTETRASGITDAANRDWNGIAPSTAIALADGPQSVQVADLGVEQDFTVAGKKWTFPKYSKRDPSANPTAMKLSWTQKTGVVKGSFSVVDAAGKKQKFTVNGVVVDGAIYGAALNKKIGSYSLTQIRE